mmetsp:Transcript_144756/g.204773  ORF Transcript_144756/g.204773 Transcript_144756/m.204773 type:complete len:106 (+) Transcript_144756:86-403(+)|eukprot:s9616_g2.t1
MASASRVIGLFDCIFVQHRFLVLAAWAFAVFLGKGAEAPMSLPQLNGVELLNPEEAVPLTRASVLAHVKANRHVSGSGSGLLMRAARELEVADEVADDAEPGTDA